MNDDNFEKFLILIFVTVVVGSFIGMYFTLKVLVNWVTENADMLDNSTEVLNTFAASHPYIFIVLLIYAIISILIGGLTYVEEFMSMCGNWSIKKVFIWSFFWLPLIFYYLFNFNLRKCCRCKEKKPIYVHYKNGQQFCHECWRARFKEPHTCSTCGEKKLLYSFKEDGTKQCEQCYKSHEND